jgi:hypothetical protein
MESIQNLFNNDNIIVHRFAEIDDDGNWIGTCDCDGSCDCSKTGIFKMKMSSWLDEKKKEEKKRKKKRKRRKKRKKYSILDSLD